MEPTDRKQRAASDQGDGQAIEKHALKQSAPAIGYRAGGQEHAPNPATPDAAAARTVVEWREDQYLLRGSHPGDRYYRVVQHSAATPHPRPVSAEGAEAAQPSGRLARWLLEGHAGEHDAPHVTEQQVHHTQPWYKVMCLTGVDYFSTLGYQPGIAALAAGVLSPIATLILVLLTLFGALPIYRRVAKESPHGQGSISMLERLLSWWQGKLFVLVLLGFVATDFVITITLSAADATAHIVENPMFPPSWHGVGAQVGITLLLITLLGAVFLKGFREAIGIAVWLVVIYLGLNVIVVGVSLLHVFENPIVITDWRQALFAQHGNPFVMVGVALLLFPKLALGLSGFETGVAVMPLVKGDPGDTLDQPAGRIRNTGKLLTVAALIMSVFLLTSSFATTVLIPHAEFEKGGEANGRALAFLAHEYLGEGFGTVYDISTIAILWFAGASAMAGLLNIVPRYLPRYGMAPAWARAARPLAIVFTLIAFAVTIIFRADVDAQGGAYATGVLVLMTSAAVAVTLSAWRQAQRGLTIIFGAIALVFIYTTGVNVVERPDGVKIASFFILAIVLASLVSRVWRSTELRVTDIVVDEAAKRFITAAAQGSSIHIIANHPDDRNAREYLLKEREQRADNNIPHGEPVLFLEVTVRDASDFAPVLSIRGEEVGNYRVLRAEGASVPNAIAAFLLWLRDTTGKKPHVYFGWTEGNPLKYLARYILFGEGDIAPLTHEVLRKAERDTECRPSVHVG